MSKWILFVAEQGQPQWEKRSLTHSGSLTDILEEYRDFTDDPLPGVGYRFTETIRIERYANHEFPDASTHYRESDWVVVRVEEFPANIPSSSYDSIAVCYCRHEPIPATLFPFTDR